MKNALDGINNKQDKAKKGLVNLKTQQQTQSKMKHKEKKRHTINEQSINESQANGKQHSIYVIGFPEEDNWKKS